MTHLNPVEVYRPRTVSNHGVREVGPLQIKVYGLMASGKEITADMLSKANLFIRDDIQPLVISEGESNDLGFVIIHPGDLGIPISAH